jgi:lipoate-protein ligase A
VSAAVERKVPGGKLLRMRVVEDGTVRLTGDFFLHPEECIGALEEALSRLPSGMSEEEAAEAVAQWMEERGVQAVGFRPADLAALLGEARR